MLRYFVKRLAAVFPLVLLVSLICFALMQATPGGHAVCRCVHIH